MNDGLESMRLLIELALNSGKKRKSLQTGYLHHCYHPMDQEAHLPIPLIENFLFCLALLRSRLVENIQEAKTLLEGLLHFQNTIEESQFQGNFPIYMHEFPTCKERYTGLHVGCVIYWILKQFHQVLGQELKKKLEKALLLIVKHFLQLYAQHTASYSLSIKIAALAISAGRLLENNDFYNSGTELLEALRNTPEETCLFCPASLGSILVSLMMVYPSLNKSPWKFLWDHAQNTWHCNTGTFAAPSLKEWQQGEEPQVSVYDLVCGYFAGKFSDRALNASLVPLEAALIPTSDERFSVLNYPLEISGTAQDTTWFLHHGEHLAYSYFEKKEKHLDPNFEKGCSPFKLIWGDLHRVHTFVYQGGNAKTLTIHPGELNIFLEGPLEVEDKEKSREIMFFMDAYEGIEFLVAGQKSSTFVLGEEISIKDKGLSLTLSFHLEEGEGRFLGHRMLGNRPAQLANKGSSRFNAYDWQLFLRTISRSDNCRIKVSWVCTNS